MTAALEGGDWALYEIIQDVYERAKTWPDKGVASDFIPAISNIDTDLLAISVTDVDGRVCSVGDTQYRFTLQSVSKVVALALCLETVGRDKVFSRVGVEGCGDRFNDIYRLEKIDRIPANPFINAGALAVVSCIPGESVEERYELFRSFTGRLLGNDSLDYSRQVCQCETETAHKNRTIAHMLLESGVYDGVPEEHLEVYYRGCAFLVNAVEVSRLGAVLAGDGVDPVTKERLLKRETCQTARAIMAGCGLYGETGAYNIRVGIPTKSGSSGILMASARKRAGIAVYAPGIDSSGNSVVGTGVMAELADRLDLRMM